MGISSFKFVSPGVFVNEVDNSQLPRRGTDMGPVIIGRAERGPAMVPVKVESFAEFVETFGAPIAGNQGDDVWRQGNRLGPTYGAYAAQAYLKNGSPITFVRLLGDEDPNADPTTGRAGWAVNGAYGLFVGNGSADNLAAIIYAQSDSLKPVVATSDNAGKITLEFEKPGATTAGARASGVLSIADVDQDDNAAKVLDAADEILVANVVFGLTNATYENLTIKFDLNAAPASPLVPTWNGGWELTVGLDGLNINDGKNGSKIAEAIRDAVNTVGLGTKGAAEQFAIRMTASSQDRRTTLLRDVVGAVNLPNNEGFLDVTSANGAIGVEDEVNGADISVGAGDTFTKVVTLDRTDKSTFIREILNTNPTLTNSRITSSSALEVYYLGATFEQSVENALGGAVINQAEIRKIGEYSSYRKPATQPATPWVLSQFTGSKAALTQPITASNLTQLFRFHSLYSGDWEQRNFKISISDIKGPTSEFLKYGSFSVLVREASDSDAQPIIYERFTNVNLDPTSSRYIASVIGDSRMIWRDSEKRYVHVGEFINQSRFVRVEVAPDIETGAMNPEFLPFGFAVPGHDHEVTTFTLNDGETEYSVGAAPVTQSQMPKFFLRQQTKTDAKLASAKSAFFGISTDRPNNLGRFDESYTDIVKPLSDSEDMFDVDAGLFTLDWVCPDATAPAHAVYQEGALFNQESINAQEDTDDNGNPIPPYGYTRVLAAGYDKFTMPLCGGTDGLDVHEIEPFCNDVLEEEGESPQTSSAYYSVTKAIDTVSDPEVVECNVMVMPGIFNAGLTGKLVATCEQRADALAIIDVEGDYTPRGWNNSDEEARLPVVEDAISSLKSRGLNSSYGCAFFPWVQVRDDISNRLLWMPPSVPALGTLASSAANSELWFAPAGFTRGGLSQGAGGVPVTQTRLRLSSKERDALYEVNINPIAQFPAEGIVVFGQKTLQVTPSALDRINVRRLMIYVKKEISRMASTVLFDQNLQTTWNRFTAAAEPFLESIQSRFGLTEFKVVLDETTTTPELVDRNIVYAKIFLKPARAIEYIAIDFVITNTGASFDD